jgi:hypothetical protein
MSFENRNETAAVTNRPPFAPNRTDSAKKTQKRTQFLFQPQKMQVMYP